LTCATTASSGDADAGSVEVLWSGRDFFEAAFFAAKKSLNV
jgi:hypothetical protein